MALHCLDLGVPRFLQFSATLVFSGEADLKHLRGNAVELLKTWPSLQERVNLLGGRLSKGKEDVEEFWKSKTLTTYSLKDVIPATNGRESNSKNFDDIFSFPTAFKSIAHPPVLSIRAVLLRDGCTLRFIVQHPFCDAAGLYHIIEAYRSLLDGKSIKSITPRQPIELSDKLPAGEMQSKEAGEPLDFAKFQEESIEVGWRAFGKVCIRQLLLSPEKLENAIHIPASRIGYLREKAEAGGIKVTPHDILLACIYKSCTASPTWRKVAKDEEEMPPFNVVLNIKNLLKENTQLHNPFINVNVPPPTITATSKTEAILNLAAHIRSTIVNARSKDCLSRVLYKHQRFQGNPIGARDQGSKFPTVFVSSWAHLPLFDLELQLSASTRARLCYIKPDIAPAEILRRVGCKKLANVLETWKDGKGGFWVHGALEKEVWSELDYHSVECV